MEHHWLSCAIETHFLFNSTFDFIKNHQLAKAWIPNSTKRLKQCLHIFVYFYNSIITEDLTCFFIQWRVISRDIFTKEIEKREIRVGIETPDLGWGLRKTSFTSIKILVKIFSLIESKFWSRFQSNFLARISFSHSWGRNRYFWVLFVDFGAYHRKCFRKCFPIYCNFRSKVFFGTRNFRIFKKFRWNS